MTKRELTKLQKDNELFNDFIKNIVSDIKDKDSLSFFIREYEAEIIKLPLRKINQEVYELKLLSFKTIIELCKFKIKSIELGIIK